MTNFSMHKVYLLFLILLFFFFINRASIALLSLLPPYTAGIRY